MIRNKSFIAINILLICVFVFSGFGYIQNCEPIDRKQMREMLTELGYEVKNLVTDPGKEKYSVTLLGSGLDIPVAAEMSGNSKYIWLTVNLGNAKAANDTIHSALLKQNSKIQPNQFYITQKGLLMMGLPIENRGVTNAYLREKLESIATRVGETKSLWQ
jgi:hypothetical protein